MRASNNPRLTRPATRPAETPDREAVILGRLVARVLSWPCPKCGRPWPCACFETPKPDETRHGTTD